MVTIRHGETQSVSVNESLADNLIVDVVNGELIIDLDSRSFNIGRDLTASVTGAGLAEDEYVG